MSVIKTFDRLSKTYSAITPILIIILLIITALGGSIPIWLTSNVEMNTKGNSANDIDSIGTFDGGNIKTMAVCYKPKTTQLYMQRFIAEHFDLVLIKFAWAEAGQNIKNMNPNVNLIGYSDLMLMGTENAYWSEVNQHENWFYHDIYGNRLLHNYYGTYALDITSTWKDFFPYICNNYLEKYPFFDGILADDAWNNFQLDCWTVPSSYIPNSIYDNWEVDMKNMIINAKDKINGIVIQNAYDSAYAEITGYVLWECFAHSQYNSVDDEWWTSEETLQNLDYLQMMNKQGYTCIVSSGAALPDNPSSYELQKAYDWMLYSLCCFLMFIDNFEKNYFVWNQIDAPDSDGYYEEMDYEHGRALNDYYKIKGEVYRRDFENSTVVANISDHSSYTVNISGKTYELGPKQGLIIHKDNSFLKIFLLIS